MTDVTSGSPSNGEPDVTDTPDSPKKHSYGPPPKPHFIECTFEDVKREFVRHPFSSFYFFNCASGK